MQVFATINKNSKEVPEMTKILRDSERKINHLLSRGHIAKCF